MLENEISEEQTDVKVEVNSEIVSEETQSDKLDIAVYQNLDTLSLEELNQKFKELVKSDDISTTRPIVDTLKNEFNKKQNLIIKDKKEAFTADGSSEEDFFYSTIDKTKFEELQSEYRVKKNSFYKTREESQKDNLQKREDLVEELKTLIENADYRTMYGEFNKIQERWRNIGSTASSTYNQTWGNYKHHVNRFYELLHLNNDLREKDYALNLEKKQNIVIKAKELLALDNTNKAFTELQELHIIWKEETGPVAKEFSEVIWKEFSEITKKIHDAKNEINKQARKEMEQNYELKLNSVQAISDYAYQENSTHEDWQNSIKEMEDLKDVFFAIGKTFQSKQKIAWSKFNDAIKGYNNAKNSFYKNIKSSQQDNLIQKTALLEIAKSLDTIEDSSLATNECKRIQAEWKKIGHVPRKNSDKIWKEFKEACNGFFDNMKSNKNKPTEIQAQAFKNKELFFEDISSQEAPTSLDSINDYSKTWASFETPRSLSKELDSKFNKFILDSLKSLNIDKSESEMILYRFKIDELASNRKKLEDELFFVRKKKEEIEKEIRVLQNNIGFFSSNNSFVDEVNKNIENMSKSLNKWAAKLRYLNDKL
ncbi:MAG: DUF349 domain-containing protein [Flavobacteriaceae bacterium]|nr:DUF349 domain-containing protein [Flavobacteriaceae bacterium]